MVALTAHPDPTPPVPAPSTPTPSAPAEPFPRAHLLELILDPTKSLHDVAASLNVTLDRLSLFLASDQGEALLSQAHNLATVRTRFLATAHLHKAIAALGTMLDDFNATAKATRDITTPTNTLLPNTAPSDPTTLAALHFKYHDHARRAAHLLLRLAHFNPLPRGTGLPPGGSAPRTHDNRAPSSALPTRVERSTTSPSPHSQLASSPPRPSAHGSVVVPPAAASQPLAPNAEDAAVSIHALREQAPEPTQPPELLPPSPTPRPSSPSLSSVTSASSALIPSAPQTLRDRAPSRTPSFLPHATAPP